MLGVYRIGANHQANGVARQRRTGGSLERLSGVANAAWVALVGVGVEIKLAMGMSVGLVGSARLFFWSVGGAVGVRFYDFIILMMTVFGRNVLLLLFSIGAVYWLTMTRIIRSLIMALV